MLTQSPLSEVTQTFNGLHGVTEQPDSRQGFHFGSGGLLQEIEAERKIRLVALRLLFPKVEARPAGNRQIQNGCIRPNAAIQQAESLRLRFDRRRSILWLVLLLRINHSNSG